MLVQAGLESKTPAEIAAAYEAAFHADEALVNILPAHVFPRATEHIAEMLALAEALEDAGLRLRHARGQRLLRGRGVPRLRAAVGQHASTSCGPATGARSSRTSATRPTSRSGRRPARADCSSGRRRAGARASPAGTSSARRWRCATSATAFDIHTGGIDNVFPHHEDEIAQSAPIVGDVPARHWVHGEFLLMAGQKMAKSAGNFQRVTELVERGIDPLAFRYLRADLDATRASSTTRTGRSARPRPRSSRCAPGCARSGAPPADGPWAAPAPLVAGAAGDRPDGHRDRCRRARRRRVRLRASTRPRDGPVRSPLAGRAARSTIASSRRSTTTWTCRPRWRCCARSCARRSPADERRWLVLDADAVLGLDLHRVWETGCRPRRPCPDEVRALVAERDAARAAARLSGRRRASRAAHRRARLGGRSTPGRSGRTPRPGRPSRGAHVGGPGGPGASRTGR